MTELVEDHLGGNGSFAEKLSIIIPAYNESRNIVDTILRIRYALLNIPHEIIVVDDGSSDDTFLKASSRGVIVLRHRRNMGKGAAFRTGTVRATGGIIVQIDADLQFLPSEIPRLVTPIRRGEAHISLATRFRKGAAVEAGSVSLRNRVGNFVASLLTSVASFRRVTDIQAGFKAFSRSAIRNLNFRENGFSYEPEIVILASKRGYRITEVPISYTKRRHGLSKINFLRDAYQISKTILRTSLRGSATPYPRNRI